MITLTVHFKIKRKFVVKTIKFLFSNISYESLIKIDISKFQNVFISIDEKSSLQLDSRSNKFTSKLTFVHDAFR